MHNFFAQQFIKGRRFCLVLTATQTFSWCCPRLMGDAIFRFRGGTILIRHGEFHDWLCSTGHGGCDPHVVSRDHGGLLASTTLDPVEHCALINAGGLTIIHPGVDVPQDFVQGYLHGYLHVENFAVQGAGEEDGQHEGVHLVHQDPHAPLKNGSWSWRIGNSLWHLAGS